MEYRTMHQCKCGKIFDKNVQHIPKYCPSCTSELISERYLYNLTTRVEETFDSNAFGGYDYIKVEINKDNLKKIVGYKKWFKLYKRRDCEDSGVNENN